MLHHGGNNSHGGNVRTTGEIRRAEPTLPARARARDPLLRHIESMRRSSGFNVFCNQGQARGRGQGRAWQRRTPGTARWASSCPRFRVLQKQEVSLLVHQTASGCPQGPHAKAVGKPTEHSQSSTPLEARLVSALPLPPVFCCLGAPGPHCAMPYSPNPISNRCALSLPLPTHLPPPSLWASASLWAFIRLQAPSFVPQPPPAPRPTQFSPGLVSQELLSGLSSAHSLLAMPLLHSAASLLFPGRARCLHLHLRWLGPTSFPCLETSFASLPASCHLS